MLFIKEHKKSLNEFGHVDGGQAPRKRIGGLGLVLFFKYLKYGGNEFLRWHSS